MSVITYKDSLYSFRINSSFIASFANNGPDAATLAQIENYLSAAADNFYQHKRQAPFTRKHSFHSEPKLPRNAYSKTKRLY
jgi:hypothetical protein